MPIIRICGDDRSGDEHLTTFIPLNLDTFLDKKGAFIVFSDNFSL